jgi:phosphatidylglycerol:prolipoprotein diacylglycerol transferase
MLAYVPYLEQPSVSVGPLTIHAFGVIVAGAVVVGLSLGARRFKSSNLDVSLGERMGWWTIVGGFLGAHVFSVLFYFPGELARNPLILFKLWEDIASFGSIIGGVIGMWLFFRIRAPSTDPYTRWQFVDVVAYAFPFSLMIGRMACAIAHDHPGTITSFPLAISLRTARAQEYFSGIYTPAGRASELPNAAAMSTLGFHDLGWYEFLYLALVVVPAVFVIARWNARKSAPLPGTLVVAFALFYMPVRFALDFLRVSDARYVGLTPAQWTALSILLLLPLLVRHLRTVSRNHASPMPPGLPPSTPP